MVPSAGHEQRAFQRWCAKFRSKLNVAALVGCVVAVLYLCLAGSLWAVSGRQRVLNVLTGLEVVALIGCYRLWWVWEVPLGQAHRRRQRVCWSLLLMGLAACLVVTKFSM